MNLPSEEFIERLKKLAAEKMWSELEDFNPYEMSGGNYDDAYYGGVNDGEIATAREVLGNLGVFWA